MTIENDEISNVAAIHVAREGEVSADGHPHVSDMDCWCEPICYTRIEHPNAGKPISIVCHQGVVAIVGLKPKKFEEKGE